MADRKQRRWWEQGRTALGFLLLCFVKEQVSAQIRYTVAEEVKAGHVIGNIAKDLGLDSGSLADKKLRLVSGHKDPLFEVNENNGMLLVARQLDREELCESNEACLINLKIVVDNPLEIHYVAVEVTDINDHSPSFQDKELHLEIAENTRKGTRFELQNARDPDVGVNSIRSYKLLQTEHFDLELQDSGYGDKTPYLVLQKPLDRESIQQHSFKLIATDGGIPPRSGTLNITVKVLDINDNPPECSQRVYTVNLAENSPVGTTVMNLNATDADEGINGDIEYSFSRNIKKRVNDIFALDSTTGEIKVKGEIDFEEHDVYSLIIQAIDKGQPPMAADCRVMIKIQDVNDNKPEIDVTSLSNVISEDVKPGTVISLISVKDRDSGMNGKVVCSLSGTLPFDLKPSIEENMYSLVTKSHLDRENTSQYDITIQATDLGVPPMTAFKSLVVEIADVNDNSPQFSQNPLELYLLENNAPGASIFSVSASDNDLDKNAAITYHIARGDGNDMASFLNVNSDTGVIHALKSFDFETTKAFKFQVVANDSGSPSLSSNVTVNVYILDQNDNAPVILYPVSANGSFEGVEEVARNVKAGHLVTKVRACDSDVGYNGWLLFALQEVSDHTLFSLDRYTGQIRTLRAFTETDEAEQKLVVLVKDNGNVSQSATATIVVKVVEPKEAFASSDVKTTGEAEDNDITFYLIITLGSVSVLFIVSIIVLIAMQCSKSTDSSKYLQDTNYDGTLCHSIQYRSGDKRYMLVGPRMSIGSTIVPGSNANTLVVPDRRSRASCEVVSVLY
ncbi:protocadherin gamma-A5-like [Engraulis encrasicolus]|uniref:protocadherin gamma-A5-like n=1 Tax=Engraulis encrasicolus TaxID=184585 RepID=UPI002FD40436